MALIGMVNGQTYAQITAAGRGTLEGRDRTRCPRRLRGLSQPAPINSAAPSRSPATCAIHTPPTPIPRPTPNTRSSWAAWRSCATRSTGASSIPCAGQALSPDDPRMRALESYILAQRKGKVLEYGKR